MSSSTPSDLAIAFRSLARRLREAPTSDTPGAAIDTARREVDAAVAAAAAVMGTSADAEAVAGAIQQRHGRDWTDEDLAAVQASADRAAGAIRTLQQARR